MKRSREASSSSSADAMRLLEEAEAALAAADGAAAETVIDANWLKTSILSIERQINTNMQMRMKYSEHPERFMESELALYQSLKDLHSVAAVPELFPVFVRTKVVPSILGLLAHENSDITNEVLDLLHEMTSAEDAAPDDLCALVDALLQHDAASILAHNVGRLDETNADEADAIHSTLSIFESVLEARPEAADDVAQKTPLLPWILNRVRTRGFHAVKLYASELLALLLQQRPANQAHLGQCDGMLTLLTAAAQYKRREPADLEEAELIENLYHALCHALQLPDNQAAFLRAEGIELMVLTLKEGRYAARCALRALDAALTNNGANCERLVDIRGFKTLFPLLGGGPPPLPPFAKGKAEREAAQRAHDDSVCSIVCTLFDELGDERRQRLLGKFAEDDIAKALRTLQLRASYDGRVRTAALAAYQEAQEAGAAEEEEEEEEEEGGEPTMEERIYLARADAGLGTLQKLDTLLGYLATARVKALRVAVLRGLYEQGCSLRDVASTVDEHLKLDGAGSARDAKRALMLEAVTALAERLEQTASGAAASGAAAEGAAAEGAAAEGAAAEAT